MGKAFLSTVPSLSVHLGPGLSYRASAPGPGVPEAAAITHADHLDTLRWEPSWSCANWEESRNLFYWGNCSNNPGSQTEVQQLPGKYIWLEQNKVVQDSRRLEWLLIDTILYIEKISTEKGMPPQNQLQSICISSGSRKGLQICPINEDDKDTSSSVLDLFNCDAHSF